MTNAQPDSPPENKPQRLQEFVHPSMPTGAKLQREHTERSLIVNQIAKEMKLRQWAVEQAVKTAYAIAEKPPGDQVNPGNIKELTKFFYEFTKDNV
jgi:hypothetical protein